MTLIECFINSPVENIAASLCLKPDKVIFIGSAEDMHKKQEKYRLFLEKKGIFPDFICKDTEIDCFESAKKAIKEAVLSEKDCVLDITGGQENVLLAVGYVYNSLKATHPFKIMRFDENSSLMTDVITKQKNIGKKASLSVAELISLYGGMVSPVEAQPKAENEWIVNALWKIVSQDPLNWNKATGYLTEFEKKSCDNKLATGFRIDLNLLKGKINNFDEKLTTFKELICALSNAGLLINTSCNSNFIKYTYKNLFIKNSVRKAGNILEMKTFFAAKRLKENSKPYFDDLMVSVNIDWDGVVHKTNDTEKDTKNEIDIILMRGCVPIFISCKNGQIEEIELYKLSTVASRFGGKFAKKMLIATDFERETVSSAEAYRQRAKDMNTVLVEQAAKLLENNWENILKI